MEEMEFNMKELFSNLLPKKTKKKHVKVPEALEFSPPRRRIASSTWRSSQRRRCDASSSRGSFFSTRSTRSPAVRTRSPRVSRQGVQRDLLPIVEGSTVSTKHGMVRTDQHPLHRIGAFHVAKPSDLIPESKDASRSASSSTP